MPIFEDKSFKDYVNGLPAATENDLASGNNMPIVSASEIKKMGGEKVAARGELFALRDSVWDSSTYSSMDELPFGAVYIQGEIHNKPTCGRACVITYTDKRNGNKSQLYTMLDDSNLTFIRSCINNVWNDWRRVLTDFDFEGILNFVAGSTRNELKKIELTYENGKYIGGYTPTINTNVDYCITTPIELKSSETILILNSAGYRNAVAVFSLFNEAEGTYSVLQRCGDESQKVQYFSYTNETLRSQKIVCSLNRKYKPKFAYILPKVADYEGAPSLSVLDSFGAFGDSYTAGALSVNGELKEFENKYSWAKILAKMCGIPNVRIYAQSGFTTRHAKDQLLPIVMQDDPLQMYALCLGINDSGKSGYGMGYLGTPSDMNENDYEQSADTFYGNYYRCIRAIQSHAPNAEVVMIMPASFSVTNSNSVYRAFREACVNIANKAGITCIDTSLLYQNRIWTDMNGGHPTIVGYAHQAVFYRRVIEQNLSAHTFDKFI